MGWTVYNSSGNILSSIALTDNSVTSGKIAALAVTNAKLADDAVGADELAANAVVNLSVASGANIALNKLAATTASRILVSDGSGVITPSSVTAANLTDLTDSGATTLHSHAGGGPTEATKAVLEEDTPGSSTANRYVSPEVAKFHPGVAKAWVHYDHNADSVLAEYNVSGVVSNATGDFTVSYNVAFSSANYAIAGNSRENGATNEATGLSVKHDSEPAAGSCRFVCFRIDGTRIDSPDLGLTFHGDQ